MVYLLTFLEGIITFISPCLLPLLPVYLSYFAGQEGTPRRTLLNAAGFISGFTMVFVSLGAFAGVLGRLLIEYSAWVNRLSGILMLLLGLSYMGVFRLPDFSAKLSKSKKGAQTDRPKTGFFTSMVFGMIFSIAWTPCVGTFLGSALMLAATQGSSLKGIVLLVCYSAGLGIPFLLSAVLIHKLKTTFDFIKRHYKAITLIAGGLLSLVGILMATGLMGYWISFLS